MRLKHMSRRIEASYLHYIIDYIRFCGKRHPPREMGASEIRVYLSHLATDKHMAAFTQNTFALPSFSPKPITILRFLDEARSPRVLKV